MRRTWEAGITVATMFFVAWPAISRSVESPLLRDMVMCEHEASADRRLECYDKAVKALDTAARESNLLVLDRNQVETARNSLFGFTIPSLSSIGLEDQSQNVSEFASTAQSVSKDGNGRLRIKLEDGAIWIQTDDSVPFHSPHAGSKIVIKRALLGTYFIHCDGQIGFRARRES